MTQLAAATPAIDGLFASTPEPLSFAPSLQIRAFQLLRERGNVLIYSARGLDADAGEIEARGGVSRQYLNHRHEAAFASRAIAAPLFVHENERQGVADYLHVRGTFSRRHMLDEDFEVIPTPGHTTGATSYLWDTGEHRLLFTGDTIHLHEGEWRAAVLGSSDRARYLESLDLIRGLDFDVLVPWAASGGHPFVVHTTPANTRHTIAEILDRIWRGESG
jgi:glyoxylase-like metal-dependent hydrolase (beta-lactamase superfamily II)